MKIPMRHKFPIWLGGVLLLMACGGESGKPKPEAPWQREAKFRTFLKLTVSPVPPDSAKLVLDTLIRFYGDDSAAFRQLVDFLTPPLSDPNSQLRNDEYYIPLLEAQIASPYFDSLEKVKPRYRLEMALKNRVGHPATDFTYTLANGRRGTLYEVEAPYTLVYINNPDCNACEEMLARMKASSVIEEQMKRGRLKIVAIYPDEDLAAWRKHLSEVPNTWINGYDAELAFRRLELYDLRAIPSLYLLDRDKRVIFKDCTVVDWIEMYLMQQQ